MGEKSTATVYAAYNNKQEIRMKSSSGCIFTALANAIFAENGVVCGAVMDAEGKVFHSVADNEKDLAKMRGSKYVKSDLFGCYIVIKEQLEKGVKVLFSGTPCQVDGLYRFLDKEYKNLLTCDLVCHGTPKARIFEEYIKYLEKNYDSKLKKFYFRRKETGWKNFALRAEFEDNQIHEKVFGTDPYSKGFQDCYFLTEGCYQCQYASTERVADITLGDFWGFESRNGDMEDTDEGISLVMCNTDKGKHYFDAIKKDITFVERDISDALPGNQCLTKCFSKPAQYDEFWEDYKNHDFSYVAEKYLNVDGKVYVDKLNKDTIKAVQGKNVIIVPSDGVGSKGDEAMIRGALNLLKGANITLFTPRDEQWKGWIVDRTDEFAERYVPLEQLTESITEPVHMVIIGADIMDGLYGDENGLYRLKAAEKVIDMGGIVDVFSCSFREHASIEILKQIINIGAGLRFHLRDQKSLENFERQTGLHADFFPDLAFLSETVITGRSEKARAFLEDMKEKGKTVIGVNFNEHSCSGFYFNPDDQQRKQYVSDVLETLKEVLPDACVVVIPHDTKEWRGHYADAKYAMLAETVLHELEIEDYYIMDSLMWEAELLHVLSYVDVLISGRMHLTIAGIRKDVVPIGYMGNAKGASFHNSEKFKGMYEERVGRTDLLVESKKELAQRLEEIKHSIIELKKIIVDRNSENEEEALALIKKYRSSLEMIDDFESIDFSGRVIDESLIRESEYIFEKEQFIRAQRQEKWDLEAELRQSSIVIQDLRSDIESKDRMIQEREQLLNLKENQLIEKDNQLQEKDNQIICKDGHIDQLLQKERDYVNLLNSKGVRVLKVWWKLKDKMFPQGSKRRLVAKFGKKFLKHPIYMLKKCTPSRISRTLHYMKTESAESISNRLDAATVNAGEEIERIKLDLFRVNEHMFSLSDVEKLQLPKCEKPLVSIVLPVYNQFHYTYNCLKSIIKYTEGIDYEVILADDCSTDLTKDIEHIVENIVVAKTPENMRFLGNCNNAAKYAKGDYIFFLNNDTQVQENWLSSLLELMDRDEKIGMVGSKLLYPDGALQEAGGILWKDGSAWNYGNQKSPLDSEFNYVKEADYISGAAIMIRKSLWEEIGGFDDRYAPAYYEDTDLAFEVRKHGYKVMYQPLSQVVHFEGVSNGTDTSSGQKEYQIVNQKKFYEKWKTILKDEHFPNGEKVFLAKDRSRDKKHILVIDHYVPHHDKDAGGKCTFMYLQMFVKMGMQVTFLGDNFYPHQPYTQELNQMGIEVLYGNYYYNNWKQWLKENAHYFDYIYLQRPHISIKYIDIVKEYSNAKILYFAHDLHHIRERREYELTGDEEKLKSSEKWKKIEYELFEKTDVGHVVGNYEQKIMQEAFPDTPVRNIPLYIYNELPQGINKDFSTRNNIMYVGGFGHPPNIDAVVWFGKEVFPKILKKYPDMVWYVAGGSVPQEVKELASDNIKILGFVPDDKLEELYRTSRMAVVPLRVGAGVKGKVVESAYFQIPLVTTTIGAEGLDDQMGNMVVEDDVDKMVDIICSLYEDYDKLKEMSDAGEIFIRRYFTEEKAVDILELDLK
ncbi:MAG: Coenzyme F420 hydrogenase/dehydrogenase, beta subunit C-terminal domain [Eubacteriales bacterium]|nr:Coenzyme F420 hydrogenase/dehydrogenase, beta subunit C-terminal domain [Eubacteriales bacterium]